MRMENTKFTLKINVKPIHPKIQVVGIFAKLSFMEEESTHKKVNASNVAKKSIDSERF